MSSYLFPAQAEKIEGLCTPYEWVRDLLYGNEVGRIAAEENITENLAKRRLWEPAVEARIRQVRQEEGAFITHEQARRDVHAEFGQNCGWKESNKPYLCFPYARGIVNGIVSGNFPYYFNNTSDRIHAAISEIAS